MGRKPKVIRICPRCGQRISALAKQKVGDRVYLYAQHYLGTDENGRRIIKKCYLGPLDGYVYVTKMHSDIGLTLRAIADKRRLLEYITTLLNTLLVKDVDEEVLEEVLETLNDYVGKLRDKLERMKELPAK